MEKDEKVIKCMCGCHVLVFSKFKDEKEIWVGVYENRFYSEQGGKLKDYFKRLWSAILGKEFLLFDIVIEEKDAECFNHLFEEKGECGGRGTGMSEVIEAGNGLDKVLMYITSEVYPEQYQWRILRDNWKERAE